jgi:hypothetical protein
MILIEISYIVNAVSPSMELVQVFFDTGADPFSFVNRKVATWIRTQQGRYGEHDDSDSMTLGIVALAGTSLTSSTYGSVSFNLTFFIELSKLN